MKKLTEQEKQKLIEQANHMLSLVAPGGLNAQLYIIALAALKADSVPVWGQARFKGGDWSSCTAEHAAMVMASPDEWGDYECRYLYTTPPTPSAPDGWKMVPVEPTQEMIDAHTEGMVSGGAMKAYREMLEAAPAPGDS